MFKLTTVESAKSGVTSVRFNSNTTSDTHEVDNPEEFQFRLPVSSYIPPHFSICHNTNKII